jgi:hypothetical protein
VLNIERGKHVNFCGEQILNVFVAFAVFAAGNISVRELVDQNDGGFAGEDRVEVHLFEGCALVIDFTARDRFELGSEFFNGLAPVGFDDANDDVFAAGMAANGFAEHPKSFSDARSVAKKQFKTALGLFGGGGDCKPVFGFLRQVRDPPIRRTGHKAKSSRDWDRLAGCSETPGNASCEPLRH